MTRSGRARARRAILLTRFPRQGEVKTRLAVELGAERALELHDRMSRQAFRQLLALKACREARVEVRTDASFVHAAREWLGRGPDYRYQGEGDMGDRLRFAFGQSFARGDGAVVVIGSDCPRLGARHLRASFDLLGTHDLVLGPAADGGYYLVGVSRAAWMSLGASAIFDGIPWGGPEVLAQTLHVAEHRGLTTAILETLPDVDEPADVDDAEVALRERELASDARISVVIPALDDAALVAGAIESGFGEPAVEVVVADAGSIDGTAEVAAAAGAIVVASAPGRAAQMNAGAAVASGEILCFLHADSRLPAGFAPSVRAALADPGVVATAFDFAVDTGGWRGRLIEGVGRLRWRLSRLPYGDQCLCLSRTVFDELGGFPSMPALEDYEMARRLARYGRIARLDRAVVTSGRAWEEHGLVRPTLVNLAVITGHRLGVPVERLARWRAAIRPKRRHGRSESASEPVAPVESEAVVPEEPS